jgi:hypothetical protein
MSRENPSRKLLKLIREVLPLQKLFRELGSIILAPTVEVNVLYKYMKTYMEIDKYIYMSRVNAHAHAKRLVIK